MKPCPLTIAQSPSHSHTSTWPSCTVASKALGWVLLTTQELTVNSFSKLVQQRKPMFCMITVQRPWECRGHKPEDLSLRSDFSFLLKSTFKYKRGIDWTNQLLLAAWLSCSMYMNWKEHVSWLHYMSASTSWSMQIEFAQLSKVRVRPEAWFWRVSLTYWWVVPATRSVVIICVRSTKYKVVSCSLTTGFSYWNNGLWVGWEVEPLYWLGWISVNNNCSWKASYTLSAS